MQELSRKQSSIPDGAPLMGCPAPPSKCHVVASLDVVQPVVSYIFFVLHTAESNPLNPVSTNAPSQQSQQDSTYLACIVISHKNHGSILYLFISISTFGSVQLLNVASTFFWPSSVMVTTPAFQLSVQVTGVEPAHWPTTVKLNVSGLTPCMELHGWLMSAVNIR